ncbi:thioredoxin domain-containing protein [Henriciella litoralis]|uniref:thioredoxin domain-containing protein n=1 Tax=Henriciella litoralis TaxID=568102 RepID=UPI00146AB664|nr:thioredoxin domain-containing protein [Henriciella litoralis]
MSVVPASAQAPVKLVNFTADWCTSCKVFKPVLAVALEDFTNKDVELITVDLTHLRSGPDSKQATIEASKALLRFHKAEYLWDWYGGFTGMAVMIAADTGEPMSCVDRRYSAKQITDTLVLSGILARKAAPGRRRPDGPDCPKPLR